MTALQMPAHERDIRNAFGDALVELGEVSAELVVAVSDSKLSSKVAEFNDRHPERVIDVGIAEQNLIGIAAGLALTGKTVFAAAIANFIVMRAYEPLRTLIGGMCLNVKIAGMSAGLSYPYLGHSHVCLEDLAITRVIPNFTVLYPADYWDARAAVQAAHDHVGPVYMRFGRQSERNVFDESRRFVIGKADVLREGRDVVLIGAGPMTAACCDAAALLDKAGVRATVVNLSSIKPLDEELLAALAATTRTMLTVEEHSIIGGLGSAVAEFMCRRAPNVTVIAHGVPDCFTIPGPRSTVLDHYRLTAAGVCERALLALRRRDSDEWA
jgi:transketolase